MALPSDTLFNQQWYLHNTVSGQYDINVHKAWDDYSGKGVQLIVIDSGIEYTHTDLSPNYDPDADHDYGQNDDDAAPAVSNSYEHHGTAVAGIAAASANGTGVVGVAHRADLIGYRIDYGASGFGYDHQIAAAITDAADNGGDTVNMSLGVAFYYDSYAAVMDVVTAIDYATDTGRGGLGTILVMAGGNSRDYPNEGQINGRTFDSQTQMICVAAVDRDGTVSAYSSFGANNLVSAFGSPYDGEIVSTDRLGASGYDGGDFVSDFNGTSAAAPQVTGVTALMLQANADLGWRDVQTILAYSARHVGSEIGGGITDSVERYEWAFNGAGNWNGGGLHYSQDYGYGLVDATAAVRLAESWTRQSTSTNEQKVVTDFLDTATMIPDLDQTGLSFSKTVSTDIVIERVGLEVEFTGRPKDLVIYLENPDGQEFEMVSKSSSYTGSFAVDFEFQSQQYRGENSSGEWTVRIADVLSGTTSSFTDIKLNFYGAAMSANDTYIYTNEFSDYAGPGHSRTLKDTNGGRDTLNASAVTSSMVVNLLDGTGKIDGQTMAISNIENVFGGDGGDRLIGNGSGNDLAGGRGGDTLTGGKGADDFIYRLVRDSSRADADMIRDFGLGNDRIDLSDIDTRPKAGDQGFTFIGKSKFSGEIAELRYMLDDNKGTKNDVTIVTADLDGDKSVDFRIDLVGLHTLAKGDFML